MMKVYQRFIYVLFTLIMVGIYHVSVQTPSDVHAGVMSKVTFYVH